MPADLESNGPDYAASMPNPKREIAGGDPLYVSFIDYFSDDVSGNRSKSWNKHWNAYMTHRNLPRCLLQQEFHVHFVSSSPNASITEQYFEFKAIADETHREPVRVRDASTGTTTRFSITPNAGPSDNPMQAEISGSIGGTGNYPCRKCDVGGTQAEKREDAGFHAMFEAGNPRSKEAILAELAKQVHLACSGVAQPIKDSQTATGTKDMYTQYWIEDLIKRFHAQKSSNDNTATDDEITADLVQWVMDNRDKIYSAFLTTKGFDPTSDTPVEILHTILLGIVKYIWHSSHTSWTAAQKKVFATRLQSTNTDALSIHAIRLNYIMQYAGSLIGRQFKTLAQTTIFHIRGIVSDQQFLVWKSVGELSALLWVPAIHNFKDYVADLKTAVENVLNAFAALDPSKLITKIKLHLLAHLVPDFTRFGPLIGVATEIFECFNAVFRFCSILSNHLAPSRDIALQLADQEGLKHRLTGGWWRATVAVDTDWRHAGPGVQQYFKTHGILQKLLGWSERSELMPGLVKLAPLRRKELTRAVTTLDSTAAARALNYHDHRLDSIWVHGRYAVSESAEECFVNSWIFLVSPISQDVVPGRIVSILARAETEPNHPSDALPPALVVVEVYEVSSIRDPKYGMPVLTRRDNEITSVLIVPKNIKFKFNAQHDCETAHCKAKGERPVMQERVESGRVENYIIHEDVDCYFINTHAFHNAHLLRATLPRHLVAVIPLHENRDTYHIERATELRASHLRKKQTAAEKAAQKAALNADVNLRNQRSAGTSATRKQSKRKRATVTSGLDVDAQSDQDNYCPAPQSKKRRTALQPAASGSESLAGGRVKRTVRASWKKQLAETVGADEYDEDAPGPDSDDGSLYG